MVIRLSAMGDVAMTVPVLQRLRETYPDLKITILTKPFFKPILEEIPNIQLIEAEVKGKHKGILGLYKLAKEIKKQKIGAVADLHNVLRSKILRLFLSSFGIKSAVLDKGRSEKKELTKLKRKIIQPLKTTHERYADVFAEMGFPINLDSNLKKRKYPIPGSLKSQLTSSKKRIGIAPFAAHESKMYPLDLMKKVISALNETNSYDILLFGGGKSEETLLNGFSEKYTNVISVVGMFSFKEELQTISNLHLMLSMDSGNGHLAALFQVPVITLWGATHPFAGFAPFQQKKAQQLLPDLNKYPLLPTSIYGNKEVEGYKEVMRSISSKEVLKKVLNEAEFHGSRKNQ